MTVSPIMRIEHVEQTSFRLAATVLAHWKANDEQPIEIHLEGSSGIGKSTLVARTCTLLLDEHVFKDSFDCEKDTIKKNGITVTSIDEGRRRFDWDYGSNRFEWLREMPTGKTVLFVENPCKTRLGYDDDKEIATTPQIVIKFGFPARQVCQRLRDIDKELQAVAWKAAQEKRIEANEKGWDHDLVVRDKVLNTCSSFCDNSESMRQRLLQALHLRRVETSFHADTFSADSPAVRAFTDNDVALKDAQSGFRRLEAIAIKELWRPPIVRRSDVHHIELNS